MTQRFRIARPKRPNSIRGCHVIYLLMFATIGSSASSLLRVRDRFSEPRQFGIVRQSIDARRSWSICLFDLVLSYARFGSTDGYG